MISKQEIMTHASELKLAPNIIEKDYILNCILAGIVANQELEKNWVFKGGTCLKKCFFEEYRFSEDLDFTLLRSDHVNEIFLQNQFERISRWIYSQSGIEIPVELIQFEVYKNPRGNLSAEGRISYKGPMQRRGNLPRIKLDLTADEKIVLTPESRKLYHPYSDILCKETMIQTYCIEEIFAEKLRALSDRLRPRDLYDVVHLHQDQRWQPDKNKLLISLKQKCAYKNIEIPTISSMLKRTELNELKTEWKNMLSHQISDLLPFDYYWQELPGVLMWIHD